MTTAIKSSEDLFNAKIKELADKLQEVKAQTIADFKALVEARYMGKVVTYEMTFEEEFFLDDRALQLDINYIQSSGTVVEVELGWEMFDYSLVVIRSGPRGGLVTAKVDGFSILEVTD